jgi:hypothetical protein
VYRKHAHIFRLALDIERMRLERSGSTLAARTR